MYTEETRSILAKYLKDLLKKYGINEKYIGTASNEQNYINILRDKKVILDEEERKKVQKNMKAEMV